MSVKSFIKKKFTRIEKEKITVPIVEGHYLDNRCAFITGGSSGIGYSIAESFIKNGASVIISGRDEKKLKIAKNKLIENSKCASSKITIAVMDLKDVKSLENKILNAIKLSTNKVDIFVNNAGVNIGELFPNTSENDFDNVLNTNLKGMYFCSQIIVKYMIENEIKGNILNITSSSSLRPGTSPYILSKWGEKSLTIGMAKKFLKYGIIVNGLAPGPTATTMLKKDDNDLYCEYSPSKRYLSPEEVGNIATILVSDMGRMIVGDTIYMTGGSGIITFDDTGY